MILGLGKSCSQTACHHTPFILYYCIVCGLSVRSSMTEATAVI